MAKMFDIEMLIEHNIKKHKELQTFILNNGSVKFNPGDIVECSYTKNLYEVRNLPYNEIIEFDKVAVYDFDNKQNTKIGKKFLKKLKLNKKAIEVLFKS